MKNSVRKYYPGLFNRIEITSFHMKTALMQSLPKVFLVIPQSLIKKGNRQFAGQLNIKQSHFHYIFSLNPKQLW